MNLMCEYCKAKLEGVEYRAKKRTNKGFDKLVEEHDGSIFKARNAIKDEKHMYCTCKELHLKVQCSLSLESGYTQIELNSMLQKILVANANKGSRCSSTGSSCSSTTCDSKQTIVSLLNRSLMESDMIHCRKRLFKVQDVDLSNCQLKELPPSFGLVLIEVRKLDLSRNHLSDLPATLADCLYLNSINLSRNCFTYLPYCLSKLPRLKKVQTNNNCFTGHLFEKSEICANNDCVNQDNTYTNTTEKKDWIEKYDSMRDRIVYFNKRTGEVSANRDNISENVFKNTRSIRREDQTTLKQLHTFTMENNRLKWCPNAITLMKNLSVLNLHNNELSLLPEEINHLVNLTVLNVSKNHLTRIPNLQDCIHIVALNIASNAINQFPTCILFMKKLKSLKINSNQIQRIPYEIGFLNELSCLLSHDNPIVDPPCAVFNQNTNQVLWECRKFHWNQQMGEEPQLEIHESGVANERYTLTPDFDDIVLRKVKQANIDVTKRLELQHSNLSNIPKIIYHKCNIKEIDLRNNPIQTLDWENKSTNVVSLNMSGCMLNSITEAISNLSGLESLNLECNFLSDIPNKIVELHRLKYLVLNNNQIVALPTDLGKIMKLNELHVCHNHLQHLPESIGLLSDLTVLAASHNNLKSIPSTICRSKNLKTLNLRQNCITHLPPLGSLSLNHLLLSNNCINKVHPNVFSPNLSCSINHLELNGNYLCELPHNFPRCQNSNVDMNPLLSPPLCLANEGSDSISSYCNLRHRKIVQFCDGLKKKGFVTTYDRFCPPASKVIGNTGYLIPEDLIKFDNMVDSCVNGLFFYNEFSVGQIVNDIGDLRDQRVKETHKKILDQILLHLKSFEGNTFSSDMQKRFGLFGNKVPCFAIPLEYVLLSATNPSSIFQKVKDALNDLDSLFSFDNAMLQDSFKFQSPYGSVASVENVTYALKDSKKSMMSLVIAQHIYSEEEATRKEEEDEILYFHFKKMEVRIDTWAVTKHGIRSINAEISQRIKNHSKLFREAKQNLRTFRSESEDKVMIMERRLREYDENKPYDFHLIANDAAAERLRVALQDMKRENGDNLLMLEKKFMDAKIVKEEDRRRVNMRSRAISDMKIKCCNHIVLIVYTNGRAFALSKNLLRPWDNDYVLDHQKERCYLPPLALQDKLDSTVASMNFVWTNMTDIKESLAYKRFKSSISQKLKQTREKYS